MGSSSERVIEELRALTAKRSALIEKQSAQIEKLTARIGELELQLAKSKKESSEEEEYESGVTVLGSYAKNSGFVYPKTAESACAFVSRIPTEKPRPAEDAGQVAWTK